jgi:hypothetical protein
MVAEIRVEDESEFAARGWVDVGAAREGRSVAWSP